MFRFENVGVCLVVKDLRCEPHSVRSVESCYLVALLIFCYAFCQIGVSETNLLAALSFGISGGEVKEALKPDTW